MRTDDDRKAHMEEEEDDEKMKEDKVPRECCTYLEYYECVCVCVCMKWERAKEFEQCASPKKREHCYAMPTFKVEKTFESIFVL